jgi:hypothetical protein
VLNEIVDSATDEEWKTRAYDGANLVGFTAWHAARTMDWAINCVLRGQTELADHHEWADLKVPGALFGAGATRDVADKVAVAVSRARVREYLAELRTGSMAWLEAVPEDELNEKTDLKSGRAARPEYMEHAVWQEISDLNGIPKWQFLARPGAMHVRVHYGEMTSQLQSLRAGR